MTSLNDFTGQVGSGHAQVRFTHTIITGVPKHGVSTNRRVRLPREDATTPRAGHPIGPGADSSRTVSRSGSRSTSITW
ncbi:hypothetical protein BFG51_03355 [Dietzia alimentaria]|nr:hypothetical protein BFG51_03355 [Dietzia alimentaria]